MSYLNYCLDLFEFKSLDDVSPQILKKEFKRKMRIVHPDKGGEDSHFDILLSAYVYLTETVQRLYGGRSSMGTILSPDELKESRMNHIINQLLDDLNDTDFSRPLQPELPPDFHSHFEKLQSETKGYSEWLKEEEEEKKEKKEEKEEKEEKKEDFHMRFTSSCGSQKSSALLPLEELSRPSKTSGLLILDEGYTSAPYSRPEYTDVYHAYTRENTFWNQLPPYHNKSVEDLIKEREVIAPLTDEDREAMFKYEAKKMETEKNNKQKIEAYFRETNSHSWALS